MGRDAYISNHNCKLSVRQSGTKCAVVQVYLCSGVIIAAKMTAEITQITASNKQLQSPCSSATTIVMCVGFVQL